MSSRCALPNLTTLRPNRWVIVSTGSRLDSGAAFDRRAVSRMLEEAAKIAPRERTIFVALEAESPWWAPLARDLAPENVIDEPIDRGSAPGILAALFRILQRAPNAEVSIFAPSDHASSALAEAPLGELLIAVRDAQPELYSRTLEHLCEARAEAQNALDALYPFLPAIDFERDVLTASPESLRHLRPAAA